MESTTRQRRQNISGGSVSREAGEGTNPASSAQVLTGDAFRLVAGLESESIDLIITSPPYWGLRSYNLDHNWLSLEEWRLHGGEDRIPPFGWYSDNGGILGLEPLPEWYISHLVEFFDTAKHCLKPQGSIWINLGDTYFARWSSIRDRGRQGLGDNARQRRRTPMGGYRQEKQLLLIPARFAIGMQDRRWILRNDLIWHKPNVPPRPEVDRLRLAHEHFFHFVVRPTEGRARYYYDKSMLNGNMNDVVTCNVRAGQENHSATFPEELITPRILSSCPPGGTVLDPFCGSGRALAVALKHGRRAIGFDVSPEYAAATRKYLDRGVGSNGKES